MHWHEADKRGLEKIKRQAEREDGQLLILPSETSEEAGALSGPTFDSPNEKLSLSSERYLTEAPIETEGPDLVPTSDNVYSGSKDNTLFANNQISKDAKRLSVDESIDKRGADAESSADATPQFSVGKTTEDRVGTAEAYDVTAGLVKSAGLDVVEGSNEVAMEMFEQKILPSTVSRIALMRNRPQGVFLRLTVEVLPQMPLTLSIFPQR